MFKNKTGKNRNDEKYSQTGITVKILTNHAGHRSEASLRNFMSSGEQLRACSDVLSDALSGGPDESPKPSFTALSGGSFCHSFIKHSP